MQKIRVAQRSNRVTLISEVFSIGVKVQILIRVHDIPLKDIVLIFPYEEGNGQSL